MRAKVFGWLVVVCAALSGCASQPLAPPQPSLQNLELLRSHPVAPVGVGPFTLAADRDATIDKYVSARAVSVVSPNNGSFAMYLREVLLTELHTAGKYDPFSRTVINGWLTENRLDASGAKVNDGAVGARFAVRRDGLVVYEKEFRAEAQWESSFVGAIAIPAAINEYTALYRKLVDQLFRDEEFTAATAAK